MNNSNLERLSFNIFESFKGEFSPDLRAIKFFVKESVLYLNFYFDHAIDENLKDRISAACTEIHSLGLWNSMVDSCIHLDALLPIPSEGYLVYYRKEDSDLANTKKYQKKFHSPFLDRGKEYYNAHLRLAMQNSLLGLVTSNLRQIHLAWDDNLIFVHFYFDGKITEKDKENMSLIMTVFSKHFALNKIYLRYYRIDFPIPLPYSHIVAFSRKEGPWNER